jgi:biotin carboxylase
VLLVAASRSETRAYEAAAATSGIDLWIADGRASAAAIAAGAARRPIHGFLAVNPEAAMLAATVARTLGVPWHTPDSVRDSTNRLRMRGRLVAASLPTPWFLAMPRDGSLASVADRLRFPCVVKPAAAGGRHAVVRVDDAMAFEGACEQVRRVLDASGRRRPAWSTTSDERTDADDLILEGFVPGRELALDGVLEQGTLRVLALVDKPDALAGRPSAPGTLDVTPSPLTREEERMAAGTIAHAAAALGLRHGPIHAGCRVNESGVFVLGIAPWPAGEADSRALRFASLDAEGGRDHMSLEEILLRSAAGESLDRYGREAAGSGREPT